MTAEELLERYAAGERDFSGVKLRYCDLNGADLRGIILDRANFLSIRLIEVNLTGASLRHVTFDGAELARSIFQEADLSHAYLRGGHLDLANFQGAILRKAHMDECFCEGACFAHANFKEVLMQDVYIKNTDLSYTDFRNSVVEDTALRANVSNANFRGATLELPVQSCFREAILCNTILPDGTVRNDHC
ncbi:MAG: pentapeptide repeat-containing protein [Cyanobacteria bacterium P01_F01_bin.150]